MMKVNLYSISLLNSPKVTVLEKICTKENVSCLYLKKSELFLFFQYENCSIENLLLNKEFDVKPIKRKEGSRQLHVIGKVKLFFQIQKTNNEVFKVINFSSQQVERLCKVMMHNPTSKKIEDALFTITFWEYNDLRKELELYKKKLEKLEKLENLEPTLTKTWTFGVQENGFPTSISDRMVRSLRKAGYESMEDLRSCSIEELNSIKGIGKKGMFIIGRSLSHL